MWTFEVLQRWLEAHVDWTFVGRLAPWVTVIVTLLLTWWTNHHRATFEMIDRMYGLCHTLHSHLLKEWRLTHLFCFDEIRYRELCGDIKTAAKAKPKHRGQLVAWERLFAIHIFIAYEQIYYHRKHTKWWLWGRRRFLNAMMAYFTERVLDNPRLRAYFNNDPSGRSLHLESESANYLRKTYSKRSGWSDTEGPFEYRLPAAIAQRKRGCRPAVMGHEDMGDVRTAVSMNDVVVDANDEKR